MDSFVIYLISWFTWVLKDANLHDQTGDQGLIAYRKTGKLRLNASDIS